MSDVPDDPFDGFGDDGSLDEVADDATPVTVVLLHPDDSRRALLARKLERSPGIEVIASTGDLEAGVATIIDDLPDVVALCPTDDLLDVVVRLERDAPAAAVLVLDPHAEQVGALAVGARGTLPSGGSEITKAVVGIARDEAVLTPEWAGGLLARMDDLDQRVRRLALLSETEREVLTRLADGETPFDIAEDHAVDERLVNLHVGYAVGKYHRAIEALRTLAHAEEVRAQKAEEDPSAGDPDAGDVADRSVDAAGDPEDAGSGPFPH